MSRDDEEGGVSGAGLALGAAAGGATLYLGNKFVAEQLVADAWKGKEAPAEVSKRVNSFFRKNSKLADQRDGINAFNAMGEPDAKIEVLETRTASQMESTAITAAQEKAAEARKQLAAAKKTGTQPETQQPQAGNETSKKGKSDTGKVNTAKAAKSPSKTEVKNLQKELTAAEAEVTKLQEEAFKNYTPKPRQTNATHLDGVSLQHTKEGTTASFRQNVVNEAGTDFAPKETRIKFSENLQEAAKDTKFRPGENTGIVEVLTPAVEREEKALTQSVVKGTGFDKFGKALELTGNANRMKVGAAFVAAAVAGNYIGSYIFPSYARRIDSERASRGELGRA